VWFLPLIFVFAFVGLVCWVMGSVNLCAFGVFVFPLAQLLFLAHSEK